MNIIEGILYTKDHEWVKVDGDKAYIGISDFAQENLGDIVYVEFPEVGAALSKGDVLSVVESVKAASDIYSPISGTVLEINEALNDDTEQINQDPYGSWIAVLQVKDAGEMGEMLSAAEYKEVCDEEEH